MVELSEAAGGLDSVAAPSRFCPCRLMVELAGKLSLTLPSVLASSLAALNTLLVRVKLSVRPSMLVVMLVP